MTKIKNRLNNRYNRLIVIKFIATDWNGHALWLCKCDCGKEKIISGDSLQSGNTKSCGCLEQELKEQRIEKRNPNYKNGTICGKHTKLIFKLKEERRKKDNYICQHCGITQKELKGYQKKLDVHHIDGDDTNNVEENMITLCRGCHTKLHRILAGKKK